MLRTHAKKVILRFILFCACLLPFSFENASANFTGSPLPSMPPCCDGFTHYISASGVEYVYFFDTQTAYQDSVDQGQPGVLHVFANNNGPALWPYRANKIYQLVNGNWQKINLGFWPNDSDHMLDRYKTLPEQISSTTDLRAGYNQNFIGYFGFLINPDYASVVMTANATYTPPPVTPPPAFTGSSRPPMPAGCDGFTHYISASGVEYVYFFNTQDDYQNYVDQGQPGALHVFANNNGPALWYYHVRTVYQLISGNWQEISPSFWPNDPDHILDRYKTLPEQICSTTDLRAGYNQNFIEYFGFCTNPSYASVVMTANCSLAPPKPTLTVTLDPVAGGKVTGPGINCGADCTQSYNQGRKVTLTATRNPGYKFKYWDDGTTKQTQNRITITMDSSKNLTAKFGWPTIAQSPMAGPPGTTFIQWGTDFTPNKTATLHFKKPDGSEYATMKQKLDNIGHFEIPYTSAVDKLPGTYTWWAIDDYTKRKSNKVAYEITQSVGDLDISPSSYDFGTIGRNDSASQQFTLSNTGTESLTVSEIKMSETEDFALIFGTGSNPCTTTSPTISPGGSCTFYVSFDPIDVGKSFANLIVTTNDPGSPTIEVPLSGTTLSHGWGWIITIDGMEIGASYYPFWPDMPTLYLYEAITPAWQSIITRDIGIIGPFTWSRDLTKTKEAVQGLYELIKYYNSTNRRIVILSHSWGTVISYIALAKHDDIHINKLITLGSPLNAYQSLFRDVTWAWLDKFDISSVSKPDNIKTWHNYYTSCDLISGKIPDLGETNNYKNKTRYSTDAACHSSYFEDEKEWEEILRDVIQK